MGRVLVFPHQYMHKYMTGDGKPLDFLALITLMQLHMDLVDKAENREEAVAQICKVIEFGMIAIMQSNDHPNGHPQGE